MVQEIDKELTGKLTDEWCDKKGKLLAIQKEMKGIEREMIAQFGEYKVGDVVRDTTDGKRYVISSASVSSHMLEMYNQVMVVYETRRFKTDGTLSRNHYSIPYGHKIEPTGEYYELRAKPV